MTQKYQVKVSMKQAAIVETGIVLKQGDFGMQIEIEVLDFDATGTTPQIVFRKAQGAVESTTITVSGNKYTYTFVGTELDTPGKCFCDLKLKNSTTQRISTASFAFKVIADTLDGLNEHANSYSDTIGQIWQTLQNYSDDSEAWAKGTKGGTPVPSTDDQYHNNAKYYSELSDASADASEASSEDSEAWAKGTKNGTPVGSSAPQYNNNSKYYSDLCATATSELAQAVSQLDTKVNKTDVNLITLRGIIPYEGNLSVIQADENADKTKYYYVSLESSGSYKKVMFFNTFSNNWEYYGKAKVDDSETFIALENLEFDNVVKMISNGYYAFPTPYAGGLSVLAADASANKDLIYYVDIDSANRYRLMFYNKHTQNWNYAGNYVLNDIIATNDAIETVRGIIAYNGGTQTINQDASADKTKFYYVAPKDNPNYGKVMYYNIFSGNWEYLSAGNVTIDNYGIFSGATQLEADNVIKMITNGYKDFPTAYDGGLSTLINDPNADKSKIYYVDAQSSNRYRLMYFSENIGMWSYAGNYTTKDIIELSGIYGFSMGVLPYRGGLTAINSDADADTTKKYFNDVPGQTSYLRVMEYDTDSSAWVYNGKIFSLQYFITEALASLLGFIPYFGNKDQLAADPKADKTKKYINLDSSSGAYMRILQYSNTYNAWVTGEGQQESFEDTISKLIGAVPYWAGGKGTINADAGADTSKVYFIAGAGGNQYKKMKYDSANSTWDYNGRISPNLFDTFIELYSQMLGIIPYYGNLLEIEADPFVDTSKKYFVALATSAHYLETMTYKPLSSAWAYGDKIPTLDEVAIRSETSVNIENSKVRAYLDNTIYDGSDYSYTNVLDYAANDYDYPNGETVEWEYSGTCDSFNVKVALDGDFSRSYTYSVANTARSFELKNLNPTKAAGVKVSAVSGTTETVILSQAVHATGQERMIKVDGIRNVRDIGGWDCEGGKIKYGKIFRGSAIDETGSTITANGKIVLYNLLGVRSEIDLRSTASPSTSDLGPDATRYRISGYSYLNGYNNTTDAYNVLSRVFTEVAAGNIIYMHCSGGCDRTAFYICMIEGLLGASEDDINKDYELSSFMDQAYSNNYRRYRSMGETYSNRDWAGLIGLIKAGTGNTWQEKFYNYFIGIGFTAEEITAFKNAMISK